MPSYEQIELVGGPYNGETHMWDGGDYFQATARNNPVASSTYYPQNSEPATYIKIKRHTYRRHIDQQGNRTTLFVYQGDN